MIATNTVTNYKFEKLLIDRIKTLQKVDNWRNFIYIFIDYLLIIMSIIFFKMYPSLFTYLLAVVLIGRGMNALDNLNHESSHKKLFHNQFINYWISLLFCYLPLGMSPHFYCKDHLNHHKWLGDYNLDPDRVRHRELDIERFPVLRRDLIHHFFYRISIILIPTYLIDIFKSIIFSPDVPQKEKTARRLFWVLLFLILTVLGRWEDFALFWLVPFITSFKILGYLAEISEHGGLYREAKRDIDLARNNLCHPFLRFLIYPHNDCYHLTHHLFPAVPHYNLALAHQILLDNKEYQQAHQCYGYFFSTLPNNKSSLGEMISD
jgi:fatty acid desaturase